MSESLCNDFPEDAECANTTLSLFVAEQNAVLDGTVIELSPDEITAINALAANKDTFIGPRQIKEQGYLAHVRADSLSVLLKGLSRKLNTEHDTIIASRGTTFVARYMMPADIEIVYVDEQADCEAAANYEVQDRYWRDKAKCLDQDPQRFTAARGAAARALIEMYCNQCAVSEDCLASAVLTGDQIGVKGGLEGRDRTQLIRDYQRTQFLNNSSTVTDPSDKPGAAQTAPQEPIKKPRQRRYVPNSNTIHNSRWQGMFSRRSAIDPERIRPFLEKYPPRQ